jgi:hypothetical protein
VKDAADYKYVAASSNDEAVGTALAGAYLEGLTIIPATTSPGAVTLKDGDGTARTVFAGGANSVSNLVPFFVPVGARSRAGAWKVTTGANVAAWATGDFR